MEDVSIINFSVSREMYEKYQLWLEACYEKAVEKQRLDPSLRDNAFAQACWESGYPYHGAIGGEITFSVSPTGLGSIVVARYDYISEEFDLTEYDSW